MYKEFESFFSMNNKATDKGKGSKSQSTGKTKGKDIYVSYYYTNNEQKEYKLHYLGEY